MDEGILEIINQLGRPVLRFYGWTEPAASFGYFQHYSEVERLTSLRPLVRRPTGGGIVPHDCDWTYSLAFPIDHEWYSVSATESYWRVHRWLQLGFQQLGVNTQLAPAAHKKAPGQCFAGHEQIGPAVAWNQDCRRGTKTAQGWPVDPGLSPAPKRPVPAWRLGSRHVEGLQLNARDPVAALSTRFQLAGTHCPVVTKQVRSGELQPTSLTIPIPAATSPADDRAPRFSQSPFQAEESRGSGVGNNHSVEAARNCGWDRHD